MTGRRVGGGVDWCMIVLEVLDRSAGWRQLRKSQRRRRWCNVEYTQALEVKTSLPRCTCTYKTSQRNEAREDQEETSTMVSG
jgi:hypothetical protein